MRRHAITITAAVLGLIGLGATGVLLFFVTNLAPIQALLLAFVALLGAFVALLIITLVTNTRRPAGIDPNAPHAAADPFAMSSEDLRNAVLLADNLPYGRRKHDDSAVVKRLIGKFEDEDAQRPPPHATPAWALELMEQGEAQAQPPDLPSADKEGA